MGTFPRVPPLVWGLSLSVLNSKRIGTVPLLYKKRWYLGERPHFFVLISTHLSG
jgi:hypothetical protein